MEEGEVYFSSQVKGTAHHDWKSKQQEVETAGPIASTMQKQSGHAYMPVPSCLFPAQDVLPRDQTCSQFRWAFPCQLIKIIPYRLPQRLTLI